MENLTSQGIQSPNEPQILVSPNPKPIDKLKELLRTHSIEDLTRAAQVNLGYAPNTHIPSIDEFIESDEYLGTMTDNGKGIYPYWREVLREVFPFPLYNAYDTVFLRSAIGTGKSTIARIMVLYNLAKMILMENSRKFFGLLPNKEIGVFLYALTADTISQVMYEPLVPLLEGSPFFNKHMEYYKGGYHFDNGIGIYSGSTIGRNVGLDIFLVFADEIQQEKSGSFSYNKENIDSLRKRLETRFMIGTPYGKRYFNSMMILSGSPGTSDSYAESITNRAREKGGRSKVISTSIWDVKKTQIDYSVDGWFKLFLGNEGAEPRILEPSDLPHYQNMLGSDYAKYVIDVPNYYKEDFEDDILQAIQDLAGTMTRSSISWITHIERLKACFRDKHSLFEDEIVKVPYGGTVEIYQHLINGGKDFKSLILNPEKPRFFHIDLGIKKDLTGITMGHIPELIPIEVKNQDTGYVTKVYEPYYFIDFSIGLSRLSGEVTDIRKIKEFLFWLRRQGLNIGLITLDSYQSEALRQELEVAGFNVSIESVIRDSTPFDITFNAINQNRISIPKQDFLFNEIKRFQKIVTSTGVYIQYDGDSDSTGSHGDITESLVGCVRNMYYSVMESINPLDGIPEVSTRDELDNSDIGELRHAIKASMEEVGLKGFNPILSEEEGFEDFY